MPHRIIILFRWPLIALIGVQSTSGQSTPAYTHFEARQTHPIAVTPDGRRLLALNSPEGRLSVFDVSGSTTATPLLIAEIPVGLEPVSLRARTNDEVWVVNEVSDSVSVVSLTLGVTVATLHTPDEPADVVFAQGRAFVSCARSATLRVFDVLTREPLDVIPLNGVYPRALAVDPSESRVYAAFQLSGNRTTTLPRSLAPPPPAPTDPNLPSPPHTGMIVSADDPRVPFTVLDHDIAEIGVLENRVYQYFSDVGANLFDVAVEPRGGAVWVAATDARNLTRFEPALRGHFVVNQLTRLAVPQGERQHLDLNPPPDTSTLPNPAAQAIALAQPTSLLVSRDGQSLWVAAFGSDRVARVGLSDGVVHQRIDLRPVGAGPDAMRGPRGLALHPTRDRLFIFNKISHSISVVDTTPNGPATLLAEVPVGSHTSLPPALQLGRGLIFDARLSGLGTASCASCHLDADRDGLAWDLGDPGGAMLTVQGRNNSIHDPTPRPRVMHPMKGPMTTQTLRGLQRHRLFHWRGDRPSIQSFDVTFADLLGGARPDPAAMESLAAYLLSLRHHPNPNRNLNQTLPPEFAGGNPIRGRDFFNDHLKSHCVTCHALPAGSDENIDLMAEVGAIQPIKTVPLRTVYQRSQFDGSPGAVNVTGFGLLHDGTGYRLPRAHFYVLDLLETVQELNDVTAFVLCFDTGTAPTVGFSRTLTSSNANAPENASFIDTLESQAAARVSDLVVRGRLNGRWSQWLFEPTARLYRDRLPPAHGLTRTQLSAALGQGDALTFLGIQPGEGSRFGLDRNENSLPDVEEWIPEIQTWADGPALHLAWPEAARDWFLESGPSLSADWHPVPAAPIATEGRWRLKLPSDGLSGFFRLRRTW